MSFWPAFIPNRLDRGPPTFQQKSRFVRENLGQQTDYPLTKLHAQLRTCSPPQKTRLVINRLYLGDCSQPTTNHGKNSQFPVAGIADPTRELKTPDTTSADTNQTNGATRDSSLPSSPRLESQGIGGAAEVERDLPGSEKLTATDSDAIDASA